MGAATKEITEILTQYCTTPKNHMQVLSDQELSVIFEYMTQHHQVNNMEETLNAQMAARQTAAARPATGRKRRRSSPDSRRQPSSRCLPKPGGRKERGKQGPRPLLRPRSSRYTASIPAGAGDVNLDKYDERIDKLVDAKAERMESRGQKKQKLTKKADQRAKPFGNKRRQEEQEKMKRLQRQQQMAALKKIPVKVMIPDEISVGELASRMKQHRGGCNQGSDQAGRDGIYFGDYRL